MLLWRVLCSHVLVMAVFLPNFSFGSCSWAPLRGSLRHLSTIRRATTTPPTDRSPLEENGWHLVAHVGNGMSESDAGGKSLFDASGVLKPDYSFGEFSWYPTAESADFQVVFPVDPDQILFVTGDGSIWTLTEYQPLLDLLENDAAETIGSLDLLVGGTDLATQASEYDDDDGSAALLDFTDGNLELKGNFLKVERIKNNVVIWIEGDNAVLTDTIVWGKEEEQLVASGIPGRRKYIPSLWGAFGGMNVYVREEQETRNPFDEDGWSLVAHSSSEAGLFGGEGDLKPFYVYGTYTFYPKSGTPDFETVFPTPTPSEVMFVTGDAQVWAIADYPTLRQIIDEERNEMRPNIDLTVSTHGRVVFTRGNVRSGRHGTVITLEGSYNSAMANGNILWGSGDYDYSGSDSLDDQPVPLLKQKHGGMNVYVREPTEDQKEKTKKSDDVVLTDRGRPGLTSPASPSTSPADIPTSSPLRNLSDDDLVLPDEKPDEENVPTSSPTVTPPAPVQTARSTGNIIFDSCEPLKGNAVEHFENITRKFIAKNFDSGNFGVSDVSWSVRLTDQMSTSASTVKRMHRPPSRNLQDADLSSAREVRFEAEASYISPRTDHEFNRYFLETMGLLLHEHKAYIGELQGTGDPAFSRIQVMSIEVDGNPVESPVLEMPEVTQEEKDGMVMILSIALGCVFVVAVAAYVRPALKRLRRMRNVGVVECHPTTGPFARQDNGVQGKTFIDVDPQDDISTLGDPVYPMTSETGTVQRAETVSDSIAEATVDYDYSDQFAGIARNQTVSSVVGTLGEATGGSINAGTLGDQGTLFSTNQGTIFSDDASFEAQFDAQTDPTNEEVFDVILPPGKLGVVIDTPNDSDPPIFYAIKDSSCVANVLRVGDRLLAVDDEDVRGMTAIRVSKMIARRSSNVTRKLTVSRMTKPTGFA